MSQNDMTIDNSTGANVRADINSAIQALATNNSGSSAPSTTFATQFFADTNAGIMKLRNTSNNGYVNLFTLAGGIDVDAASNFNEDVTFTGASANIVFDKSDSQLEFADNAKAEFGTGGDFEIFHNGTDSILINDTGQLSLRANNLHLTAKNTENYLVGTANGSVELYHDNSKRLETTATGVNFLGNLTTSSNTTFTISAGGSGTAGHVSLQCGSEDAFLGRPNSAAELYFDNSRKLRTYSAGVKIASDSNSGRLVLEDTDGNFAWQLTGFDSASSTGGRGIFQDANGGVVFDMRASGGNIFSYNNIKLSGNGSADNLALMVGASDDLKIFHDGTSSFIDTATNHDLFIRCTQGNRIRLQPRSGEDGVQAIADAAVELYHDNSKKVETTSQGIQNFGSGNGNGHYHFINTTANVNRHVDFSFQRIGGSNRGTTAIIHVGENSNAQGEIIMASSGSNAGVSGGVIMNNGATSFSSNSDTRLKNKISDITDALTNIKQIDTWKYSWKDDTSNTPKLGVTAQSVESVYPEVVGKRAKFRNNSDPTEYLNVAYTELIPVCIAAIKELSAKVEALEGA